MDVTKIFGTNVFNDDVMRKWLPKDTYKALRKTIDNDLYLPPEVADVPPYLAAFSTISTDLFSQAARRAAVIAPAPEPTTRMSTVCCWAAMPSLAQYDVA